MTDQGPQVTVGSRYPQAVVAAIDKDAARLGLDRSEWMRMAVDHALRSRLGRAVADVFRRRAS